MIEVIKQQLKNSKSSQEKTNYLREFLQIMVLKNIYDQKAFNNIAFLGGTALRILFDINRFSEDLDFSLINKKQYDFNKINDNIVKFFKQNNILVETTPKTTNNVHSAFLKFPKILKELNLSIFDNQKLSIKFEIDTNPPKDWTLETMLINKTYLFQVTSFDLSSMFATKLHACFFRKYTKGRDFYDLVWYLSKKTKPNIKLLNNAIYQTEKKDLKITDNNFIDFVIDKIQKTDFKLIREDVRNFLFDINELNLLNKDFIISLCKNLK